MIVPAIMITNDSRTTIHEGVIDDECPKKRICSKEKSRIGLLIGDIYS